MIFSKRLQCWWCDGRFHTEFGRIRHLCSDHPEFFEQYDELNSFNPFDTERIPEPPEEGDDAW